MGRRAEARYWELFTAERMAESYHALYRELAARSGCSHSRRMAPLKACGSLGGTTYINIDNETGLVVPVPISLEIIGLPNIAPSSSEMPNASERRCDGNTIA